LAKLSDTSGFVIAPIPDAPRLTRAVTGTDQYGKPVDLRVVEERPLTIYLNSQEIVTAMTIGDYPEYLALGFLRNQGMLDAEVTGVDYDEEIETVVVRTDTNVRTSDLYALAAIINRTDRPCVRVRARWSIWRTWDGTMRLIRSQAGCCQRASMRRTR